MRNAPDREAIESAKDRPNSITPDAIKARIMAGEIVGALDYPEADRPLFWAAIARVRDDLPAVKPTWRTINEHHVDGLRTRQKLFRICPRQRGVIDATLAGLIALAATCAALLAGGLPA
jgi:hypothetical protein